jgi:hypothetical protein
MTRHRVLLFVLLATVASAVVAGGLLWPRTTITRPNAQRIEKGMTLAEVESILGGPARNDTTGPVVPEDVDDLLAPDSAYCCKLGMLRHVEADAANIAFRYREWESDHVKILVVFNLDGHVTHSYSCPLHRVSDSPLNTFRRWLHL